MVKAQALSISCLSVIYTEGCIMFIFDQCFMTLNVQTLLLVTSLRQYDIHGKMQNCGLSINLLSLARGYNREITNYVENGARP